MVASSLFFLFFKNKSFFESGWKRRVRRGEKREIIIKGARRLFRDIIPPRLSFSLPLVSVFFFFFLYVIIVIAAEVLLLLCAFFSPTCIATYLVKKTANRREQRWISCVKCTRRAERGMRVERKKKEKSKVRITRTKVSIFLLLSFTVVGYYVFHAKWNTR